MLFDILFDMLLSLPIVVKLSFLVLFFVNMLLFVHFSLSFILHALLDIISNVFLYQNALTCSFLFILCSCSSNAISSSFLCRFSLTCSFPFTFVLYSLQLSFIVPLLLDMFFNILFDMLYYFLFVFHFSSFLNLLFFCHTFLLNFLPIDAFVVISEHVPVFYSYIPNMHIIYLVIMLRHGCVNNCNKKVNACDKYFFKIH